jgi:uncharacterized oligopeptide transporter (OPT) family protein
MNDKAAPPVERAAQDASVVTSDSQPLEAPLPLAGFAGSPEEIEHQWYEKVYKGRGDSMVQLTWRAILMGSVLGGILSLTNLYIGLKTGWGMGVAITACILSYAIWTSFYAIGLARTRMTILENNCMQSCASAAGYSTGGTLVSAIAAYVLINNQSLNTLTLMAWIFFLAILGVTMAIPMKRQMINVEQLRFPSGVAAAETLRALHSTGTSGLKAAKALGLAGLLAAINKFWSDGLTLISAKLGPLGLSAMLEKLNLLALGKAWVGRTVTFVWDPIFIAAGAITGMRVSASMLLGGILCWAVFVPLLQHYEAAHAVIIADDYVALVNWTLWGGAACMVASGLLTFAMEWRSALRAFASFGQMLFPGHSKGPDTLQQIETPASWFIIGQVIGTAGLAYLAWTTFLIPWWMTVLAVALSFALALVACRVTGETDNTPVGAMGKVTQLTFGAIRPGSMNVNLMTACVTAGAADSSSDLLTDLKSGYLLGANPRKQFIAQFSGIFIGTVVSVLSFQLLIPNAAALGTDQFPAPAAQTWRAVAVALKTGLTALGPVKTWSIAIGGLVGLLLPLLERLFPKHRQYVPSASGVGLAWTFPFYYGLLFFIGALAALLTERKWPKWAESYTIPVASGIIAGGAIMGVAIAFAENGPEIWHKLLGG